MAETRTVHIGVQCEEAHTIQFAVVLCSRWCQIRAELSSQFVSGGMDPLPQCCILMLKCMSFVLTWYMNCWLPIGDYNKKCGHQRLINYPFAAREIGIDHSWDPHQKYCISHSNGELDFHCLLRWKMIIVPILTTSLIHFLFRSLGECTLNVVTLIGKSLTALTNAHHHKTCPHIDTAEIRLWRIFHWLAFVTMAM